MSKLGKWMFPPLAPEERNRRLRLFHTLLIVQIVSTVGLILSGLLDSLDNMNSLIAVVSLGLGTILFALVGYWLARRSFIRGGVLLLLLGMMACLTYFTVFYGTRGAIPFFYIWPIMVAAILLDSRLSFITTTLSALIYGSLSLLELNQVWRLPLFLPERFAFWHQPSESSIVANFIAATLEVIIVYYAANFLAWIASRSLQQAVEQSRAQATELSRYRSELEENVAELSRATERLQASLEVVRDVGCIVLPLFEGIVLVPLIGDIDSERARQVMKRVLHGVAEERARAVILDITGVPVIDTAVANAILQTARGARLLGATPVLVGIRAEVAQTMVDLGVDLQGIVTRSSLQEGLKYALDKTGKSTLTASAGQTQPDNGSGGKHGLGALDRTTFN